MSRGLGARPADAVRSALRDLKHAPPFEVYSVFERGPDSSNVGEAEWIRISCLLHDLDRRRAAEAHAAGEVRPAGIVVTHGTDTLQLTALFLALDMAHRPLHAPVVITGSHTPPGEGSDAGPNLAKSLHAAAARGLDAQLPPGVYVIIGRDVHLATRLTKVCTEPDAEGRYFFSFPDPVGRVTLARDGRSPPVRLMVDRRFAEAVAPRPGSPERLRPLGRVEHALVDRGCSAEPLHAALGRLRAAAGPVGVVVQGNFHGNPAFRALGDALVTFAEERGFVVIGSRKVWEELARHPRLLLLPKSLSHSAGWLKLAWLLGTDADVAQWLGRDVAGEIFAGEDLPEWISYETFPPQGPALEVVITTPDLPAAVLADAVGRLERRSGSSLLVYGFGHGHVPGGNLPIGERVRVFLQIPRFDTFVPPDGPGVERLVTAIQRFLLRDPIYAAWVASQYNVDSRELRSALYKKLGERRAGAARAAVETNLRSRLASALVGTSAEGQAERIAAELACQAPLPPDGPALRAEVDAALLAFEASNWGQWLVGELSELVARRIIKDAIMASSDRHAALGAAIDRGVHVEVRTLAMRGLTDCGRYEVGNLLMAIGVDSDRTPGWRTRALIPRSA